MDVAYGTIASPSFTRTTTNALGKSLVYTFNWGASDTRLLEIDGTASANTPASTKTYSYSSSFITSVTDEEGRVTNYTRNSIGQPTQIVDGYGTASARTTSITWHSTLHVPTEIVQPGLTTDYTWNSSGQLTQVTQTDTTTTSVPYSTNGQTRTWAYTYNSYGYLLTVDGPLSGTGDTVTYTYDTNGYFASITNEVGQTWTVSAVDGRGYPTTIVDANSITTSLTYDSEERLKSVTVDPTGLNAVTALDYDVVGDITKITRPNGSYLQYTYDDARRLTKIQDNTGAYIGYSHDNLGNIRARRIKETDGTLLLSQAATFDELGRELHSLRPFQPDLDQRLRQNRQSRLGDGSRSNVYGQAFDSLNRLISMTAEDFGTVTLAPTARTRLPITATRGLSAPATCATVSATSSSVPAPIPARPSMCTMRWGSQPRSPTAAASSPTSPMTTPDGC